MPQAKPPYGALKGVGVEWGKDGFWHIYREAVVIKQVEEICRNAGYEVEFVFPSKQGEKQEVPKSSGATKEPPAKKANVPASGAGAKPSATEPALVTGFVEQANPQSGKSPRMAVLFKIDKAKHWMTAWSDKLFPWLLKGKEKNVECHDSSRFALLVTGLFHAAVVLSLSLSAATA